VVWEGVKGVEFWKVGFGGFLDGIDGIYRIYFAGFFGFVFEAKYILT